MTDATRRGRTDEIRRRRRRRRGALFSSSSLFPEPLLFCSSLFFLFFAIFIFSSSSEASSKAGQQKGGKRGLKNIKNTRKGLTAADSGFFLSSSLSLLSSALMRAEFREYLFVRARVFVFYGASMCLESSNK